MRLKVTEDLGGGDALWLVDGYAQLSVGISRTNETREAAGLCLSNDIVRGSFSELTEDAFYYLGNFRHGSAQEHAIPEH